MASVKGDVAVLDKVLEHLEALVDQDGGAAIVAEHKKAVTLYVHTWIIPYVKAVRDDLDGIERLPGWMVNGF